MIIYNLELIELEVFKSYIQSYLTNDFILSFNFFLQLTSFSLNSYEAISIYILTIKI